MPKFTITLHVESGAPAKPGWGSPCNGCGICCLAEPCPLGMVLTGRRRGRCAALRWTEEAQRYQCGALTDPAGVLRAGPVPWPGYVLNLLARWLPKLAYRWVAVGTGCDCDLDVAVQVATPVVDHSQSDAQTVAAYHPKPPLHPPP